MKRPIIKVAAAAIIVFAVILGLNPFGEGNITFAQVIRPILAGTHNRVNFWKSRVQLPRQVDRRRNKLVVSRRAVCPSVADKDDLGDVVAGSPLLLVIEDAFLVGGNSAGQQSKDNHRNRA